MTPDGSALVYGTYLGGSDHDNGFGLEIDLLGRAYVTGSTLSNDFPTTPDGFQLSRLGSDAFVAKLNTTGSDLTYGSFLGGGFSETGWAIAPDDQGHAYVTGRTSSSDFPVTDGAFDTLNEDFRSDAFVTKLDTGNEPEPPPTPIPTPVPAHSCAPTPLGEISVGDEPRGIAVDPARQRVYVANFGSHSVSVIDSSNNTVIQTISGIDSANGITHDPTHNVIWVTSYSHAQVVPIQANAGATVFSVGSPVAVGQGPWGVAYEPVHDFVYVANSLDNTVTVVNAATDTVVDTLEGSFDQPFHLAANPVSGQVYVSNFGNARVTVLAGAAVSRIVELWDSGQPYGIAVDETRDLIYMATVAPHRIVVIGPIRGVPDQFYGWAAFHRGFGDPRRPVPLRMLAVNPGIGPPGDGGHVWATTAALDGSEANQLLFIPKGWGGYFHWPLPTNVGDRPTDGLAIDRLTDRVYVSSGLERGRVGVIGDHIDRCPTSFAASAARQATEGDSPAEQDGSAGMDQIGVEIFEGELPNPEPPDQPGSTVTGIIELQGRTDHSGTQLFLSEQPCQTVTETTAPAGVTDARGQFALNIETASPAAYLCVVQPGYLAGEISIPLGGGERITLPAGDVTGDDQIYVADVAALAALFGTGDPSVDLNADGKVDIFDLVLIASNYNRRGPVR
jgi:YVTN family beta-propeller protein